MNDPQRALPLSDVLDIVERRKRRRARVQTAAGSTLGIAAAGIAGLIVVTLQSDRDAVPAGPRPSAASSVSTPTPSPLRSGARPLDPVYLTPGYLTSVADSLVTGPGVTVSGRRQDRVIADAYALADAWGLDLYPDAKAIVAKAEVTGVDIDPRDPEGDEKMVSRFERAGLTDADAAELAQAWTTDDRTAKIFAALLIE
jgi:hypothetical protein